MGSVKVPEEITSGHLRDEVGGSVIEYEPRKTSLRGHDGQPLNVI